VRALQSSSGTKLFAATSSAHSTRMPCAIRREFQGRSIRFRGCVVCNLSAPFLASLESDLSCPRAPSYQHPSPSAASKLANRFASAHFTLPRTQSSSLRRWTSAQMHALRLICGQHCPTTRREAMASQAPLSAFCSHSNGSAVNCQPGRRHLCRNRIILIPDSWESGEGLSRIRKVRPRVSREEAQEALMWK